MLGGSADAGFPLSADCEPCTFDKDCHPAAACGQFSADTYCATLCPRGDECGPTQLCAAVLTFADASVRACLPKTGVCPIAEGPASLDGGALTRCGSLVGPTVGAPCRSCTPGSGDCQANGCYGGWWCDTTTKDCARPPTCP